MLQSMMGKMEIDGEITGNLMCTEKKIKISSKDCTAVC